MTDLFIFISLGVFVSILIARNVANVLSLTITLFALDQWAQIAHSLFVKYPFLANLIVGILIFLAFTKEFLAGKIFVKDMLRHKVMIATIALIVYSVTSSIWSPVTELALEKWIEQLPYFIVIVVMTPLLLSSHRSFEEAISNVQLFGLIMVAIFTFLVDWNMRMIVAKGGQVTIALPLALAQLGGFVFLFSLFYKKSKNIFWLMIRISAMLISMILIFKTGSRGQAIAVLIAVSVFAPLLFGVKNIKALIAVTAIIATVFILSYFAYINYAIQDSRWSQSEVTSDVESRMSMATNLLINYSGSGVYTWVFGLGSSASYDKEIVGFYTHVIPIEILAEEGLFGFSLFILIIIFSIQNIIKIVRLVDRVGLNRNVIVVLGSSSLFMLIVSFKSGALVGAYYLFLFPILIERYLVFLNYQIKRG